MSGVRRNTAQPSAARAAAPFAPDSTAAATMCTHWSSRRAAEAQCPRAGRTARSQREGRKGAGRRSRRRRRRLDGPHDRKGRGERGPAGAHAAMAGPAARYRPQGGRPRQPRLCRGMTFGQGGRAAPVNALGCYTLRLRLRGIPETASAVADDEACKTTSAAQYRHSAVACAASAAAPNGPGPPHARRPRNPVVRPLPVLVDYRAPTGQRKPVNGHRTFCGTGPCAG